MYKIIDLANFRRKATFDFYKSFEDPFYNITCNVDISNLYTFCKKNNHSIFLGTLHACMQAANEIPEFKQRLIDDQVIQYEKINPGSTILKDDETFTFAYFDYHPDFISFQKEGKEEINLRKKSVDLEPEKERKDLIFFSSIPWISFTQFKHARSG